MPNKIVIIVSKGSMDTAYPPLNLATTSVALGMEAHLFFTFWGINLIRKNTYDKLTISPEAQASGMTADMLTEANRKINCPSIPDMIKMAKEMGVKFHACSTSSEMMGLKKDDLIPEVDDIVGATTCLITAKDGAILIYT